MPTEGHTIAGALIMPQLLRRVTSERDRLCEHKRHEESQLARAHRRMYLSMAACRT